MLSRTPPQATRCCGNRQRRPTWLTVWGLGSSGLGSCPWRGENQKGSRCVQRSQGKKSQTFFTTRGGPIRSQDGNSPSPREGTDLSTKDLSPGVNHRSLGPTSQQCATWGPNVSVTFGGDKPHPSHSTARLCLDWRASSAYIQRTADEERLVSLCCFLRAL